jgi:hypothetical protein
MVADKIAAYLRHDLTVAQLVEWADQACTQGQFAESDAAVVASVLNRINTPEVRAFGLGCTDCEQLLRELGYSAQLDANVPVDPPRQGDS